MQATFKLSPPVSQNGLHGIAKRELRDKELCEGYRLVTQSAYTKRARIHRTCRVRNSLHCLCNIDYRDVDYLAP